MAIGDKANNVTRLKLKETGNYTRLGYSILQEATKKTRLAGRLWETWLTRRIMVHRTGN